MISNMYKMIMDPDSNALWQLPKIVRFQYMMILAFMWSSIFTIWTGSLALFGPTAIGHLLVLLGVLFTADVFRRAQKYSPSHRDRMRRNHDGTALYDNMWGAP